MPTEHRMHPVWVNECPECHHEYYTHDMHLCEGRLCGWCLEEPCKCTPEDRQARARLSHTELEELQAACVKRDLAEIKRLREENERLRLRLAEYEADYRNIAAEDCDGRLHCTCVPPMRKEIERLRGLLLKADDWIYVHLDSCRRVTSSEPCSCGFQELTDEIARLQGG